MASLPRGSVAVAVLVGAATLAWPGGVRAGEPAAPARGSVAAVTCPFTAGGAGPTGRRVSPGWYTETTFAQARAEQAGVPAAMVIYVYTDWCPYCREFERVLLDTPAVEGYLRENVVKVRLNPETSPAAQALSDELGVRGYPSFFVAMPWARPEKMGLRENGRVRPAADFIADIDGRMSRQATMLAEESGYLRQKGREAEAVNALSMAMRLRPADENLFIAAHTMLGAKGRWDEAVACWTGFIRRNPSNPKAYLSRAHALTKRGSPALAQADARKACALGVKEAC